jgi:hypothetical protein
VRAEADLRVRSDGDSPYGFNIVLLLGELAALYALFLALSFLRKFVTACAYLVLHLLPAFNHPPLS